MSSSATVPPSFCLFDHTKDDDDEVSPAIKFFDLFVQFIMNIREYSNTLPPVLAEQLEEARLFYRFRDSNEAFVQSEALLKGIRTANSILPKSILEYVMKSNEQFGDKAYRIHLMVQVYLAALKIYPDHGSKNHLKECLTFKDFCNLERTLKNFFGADGGIIVPDCESNVIALVCVFQKTIKMFAFSLETIGIPNSHFTLNFHGLIHILAQEGEKNQNVFCLSSLVELSKADVLMMNPMDELFQGSELDWFYTSRVIPSGKITAFSLTDLTRWNIPHDVVKRRLFMDSFCRISQIVSIDQARFSHAISFIEEAMGSLYSFSNMLMLLFEELNTLAWPNILQDLKSLYLELIPWLTRIHGPKAVIKTMALFSSLDRIGKEIKLKEFSHEMLMLSMDSGSILIIACSKKSGRSQLSKIALDIASKTLHSGAKVEVLHVLDEFSEIDMAEKKESHKIRIKKDGTEQPLVCVTNKDGIRVWYVEKETDFDNRESLSELSESLSWMLSELIKKYIKKPKIVITCGEGFGSFYTEREKQLFLHGIPFGHIMTTKTVERSDNVKTKSQSSSIHSDHLPQHCLRDHEYSLICSDFAGSIDENQMNKILKERCKSHVEKLSILPLHMEKDGCSVTWETYWMWMICMYAKIGLIFFDSHGMLEEIERVERDVGNLVNRGLLEVNHFATISWNEGGSSVELFGSMNNWMKGIRMAKSSSTGLRSIKLRLKLGKHQFKFLVDGQWKLSRQARVERDSNGMENNVLLVE